MMFWGNAMGCGGWSFLLNGLLWVGLIVLGIWLLPKVLRRTGGSAGHAASLTTNRPQAPTAGTALQILQRRYARGELSKEEYETMKVDLAS